MAERPLERDVVTQIVRALLAASWFGATLFAAGVCFSIAVLDTATFFGEPPSEEMRREGLLFSLAGALIAVCGPLGVWLFHRRRGWLYLAMALGSLGVGCAIFILLSFG